MYVTAIPNRNSPPAILLRESYREAGKVKTRTIANISHLRPAQIDALRGALSGPYPGPAVVLSQLVRYVCKSKSVRRLTPAGTPANVRLPVLSRRVPVATCCWTPSLTAGIRFVAVIEPTLPYALSNAV